MLLPWDAGTRDAVGDRASFLASAPISSALLDTQFGSFFSAAKEAAKYMGRPPRFELPPDEEAEVQAEEDGAAGEEAAVKDARPPPLSTTKFWRVAVPRLP